VNTKKTWVLGTLLAVALSAAATAPVAMRVEVEPLRPLGEKTEVAVIVQISPEDRGRIGTNAIIRIELDGGAVSSGSPMRAVRLENGGTRIDVEWPPGEHDLRVQIEDPSKEDTGIWVGKVRIPDLSPGAVAVQAERELEPTPVPSPVPTPEPALVPVPVTESEIPEPAEVVAEAEAPGEAEPPEPAPADELATAGAGVAGAAAVVEAEPPVGGTDRTADSREPPDPAEPVAEESVSAEDEPPDSPAPAAAAVGAAVAGAAAAAEALESGDEEKVAAEAAPEPTEGVTEVAPAEPFVTDVDPEIEQPAATEGVASEGESSTDVSVDETAIAEELPAAEEEQPIVEPLRSDPPPEAIEPGVALPGEPEPGVSAPAPVAAPLSAEAAAQYDGWQQAEPDTSEFSVVVTRGREPATGLDPGALRLRVGRSEVAIEKLGTPETAPLLLGLAIDVSSMEFDGWSGARGSLASLADRAGGGRGRVFVATPAGIGAWNAGPKPPGQGGGDRAGDTVASLVKDALQPFAGQRGRRFLIVLTDGRNEPTKDEWSDATGAAAAAGVPILVVALWDDDFSHRTRKNLKQLTVVSGGSLFLVQGSSQLDSAADRFGRLLDGSYALRFKSASEPTGKVIQISVTASDKKLNVSAPKSIR
jgi:hypothetical protein